MFNQFNKITVFAVAGFMIIIALVIRFGSASLGHGTTHRYDSPASVQTTALSEKQDMQLVQAQIEQLQEQLMTEQATLREQLEALQYAMQTYIENSAADSVSETSNVVVTDYEQEIVTGLELRERVARTEREQGDAIVSHLELEERDPGWANWAESEIMTAFSVAEDIDTSMFSTLCHTTYCRIDGAFGDENARGQTIAQLMTLVPWEAQAFYHGDGEEGGSGAIYILREGEAGPDFNDLI